MIKKYRLQKIFLIAVILIGLSSVVRAGDYYRIVVLGDPHLPFKGSILKEPAKKQKIINAKENLVKDINKWEDADRVVVLGDIAGNTGTKEEYEYAVVYFMKFRAPVSLINGNHDYFFSDKKKDDGRLITATAEERLQKLEYFKKTFNLQNNYYTIRTEHYLLMFLSVNSPDSELMTEMSMEELDWLSKTLAVNKNIPAIIFYHAPLNHTLLNGNRPAEGWLVAQPYRHIDRILKDNRQVFLWISGHTHTTPANKNFNSSINLYGKRILNIHCPDIDRQRIWTNSLYLYKDKAVIKTYDHYRKTWLEDMTRTVKPPI